jgi:hypothetical protein
MVRSAAWAPPLRRAVGCAGAVLPGEANPLGPWTSRGGTGRVRDVRALLFLRLLPLSLLLSCGGEGAGTPAGPGASGTETPRPTRIAVSPDSVLLGVHGDTARFTAIVRDQHGRTIDAIPIEWSSSDTAVASVDTRGLVTSRGQGLAVVWARTGKLQAERRARVTRQPNARCVVPTAIPSRGPVASTPTFESRPTDIHARYFIVDAAVIDLDDDGDSDVVLLENSVPDRSSPLKGRVTIWANDGSGAFRDVTASTLGGAPVTPDLPRDLEVVDVNGDRRPDLVVAQHGFDDGSPPFPGAPNLLLVRRPDGTLREVAAEALRPYDRDGFTHSIAAADIDCDGDVDLFEGNFAISGSAPPPHLQINDGSGRFQAADDRLPDEITGRKPLPGTFTGGRSLIGASEFCDVDRDGDADLVLGMQGVRDLLLLNDGFGRFRFGPMGALPQAHFGDETHATVETKCADVDLDGWPDLVVSSTDAASASQFYTRPHLALWRNDGKGAFVDATPADLPQSFSRGWIRRVDVGDVNADGWPDILASDDLEEYPRLFVNQQGRFIERVLSTPSGIDLRGAPMYLIDVDGNGRMDLYAARRTERHYLLFSR